MNTTVVRSPALDVADRVDVIVPATEVVDADTPEWPAVQLAGGRADPAACLRKFVGADGSKIAASEELPRIRVEAFEVIFPLVWERHTRPLERRRGHWQCASGVCRLAPECADGFTDDIESVVAALLAYRHPIENLEGWITARMANAIKDGHRVRRARDMGAQQRVRVPVRLQARLGNDPWLIALAARVLQWAGVRHTAGAELWPLGAWAEDRAAFVGPAREPRYAVADELTIVLRTMQVWDASWYEKYVERPLGRKWAPVAVEAEMPGDRMAAEDSAHLCLVQPHERDDAWLAEAAGASLVMIRKGIDAGGEPRQVVADALAAAFLSAARLPDEFGRVPLADNDPGGVVAAVLVDADAMDHVVAVVSDILGYTAHAASLIHSTGQDP